MKHGTTIGLLLLFLSGCTLFQPTKTDIRDFDREYLKNKYVGKQGWAKEAMGGLKQGQKLTIHSIRFGQRTVVRLTGNQTDYFFIIYNNRELGTEPDKKKQGPVKYDINAIEQEITKRISFLATP